MRLNILFVTALFFLLASASGVYAGSYTTPCSSAPCDKKTAPCNKKAYHDNCRKGMFSNSFSDMDTNGDNGLSFEEFKTAFPAVEQSGFDQLDNDKSGALSLEEWEAFKNMHKGMGSHHKGKYHATSLPEPSKFNAHFPEMDSDKNDRVSLEEFKAYFPEASDHQTVFQAIDLDGKGDIDHDEWHEFKQAHGLKHIE